jgi:uncharacterized membrane protein
MLLVTLLAGTLSLLYDAKWLAVLGLIGGFLTPILLSTGRDNQLALMSYMTLLNGGILAIAAFKRWTLLSYLGFGFTWLLFSGWCVSFYQVEKFWRTMFFLNLFFLIYAVAPFMYYFIRERQERLTGFAILSPNAFIAFGFSYAMIREYTALPFVSIVTLTYACLFFWMAHYLHQRSRANRDPFVLLLSQGIFFLLITVPILFSGHWITIFWAALRQTALGLFAVTVVKVFFWDMGNVSTPFRIISFIVLGLMLIGASYLYHRYREQFGADTTEEEQVS